MRRGLIIVGRNKKLGGDDASDKGFDALKNIKTRVIKEEQEDRRKVPEDIINEHKIIGLTPKLCCPNCWSVITSGVLNKTCPRCGFPELSLRIYHEELKCFVTSIEMAEEMLKWRSGASTLDHMLITDKPKGIQPRIYCSRCNNLVDGENVDTTCPKCGAWGDMLELRFFDLEKQRFLTPWDAIPEYKKEL